MAKRMRKGRKRDLIKLKTILVRNARPRLRPSGRSAERLVGMSTSEAPAGLATTRHGDRSGARTERPLRRSIVQ